MRVGILALQGDFARHAAAIDRIGHEPVLVKTPDELKAAEALIIPGGESTTMRRLMDAVDFAPHIRRYALGHAIMGTCAGMILLSRGAGTGEDAEFLGLIDCEVARNAWGRQVWSFHDDGRIDLGDGEERFAMVFIRAPKVARVGEDVEVLGRYKNETVMLRQDNIVAMAFHPELADDDRIHRWFVESVAADTEHVRSSKAEAG